MSKGIRVSDGIRDARQDRTKLRCQTRAEVSDESEWNWSVRWGQKCQTKLNEVKVSDRVRDIDNWMESTIQWARSILGKGVYGSGNSWIEVGRIGAEWIECKGLNKFKWCKLDNDITR
jgi:hypothetical protein